MAKVLVTGGVRCGKSLYAENLLASAAANTDVRSSKAQATGETRMADPLPRLSRGVPCGSPNQARKRDPYPASG